MGKKKRDATAAWRARAASEAPLDVYGLSTFDLSATPPISTQPASSDPWTALETAVKGMLPAFEANPSYSSTTRRMRELENLLASTKDILHVNHVSATTPASSAGNDYYAGYDEGFNEGQHNGYADGYEDGRKAIWKEQGTETWRIAALGAARSNPEILREVTEEIRAARAPVDCAVQTISGPSVDSSTQTPLPPATISTSIQSESAVHSSCAVQVEPPLDWASDVDSRIHEPDIKPAIPSRDLSILRSNDNMRPFGTLQRRSRRVRGPSRRPRPSRHTSNTTTHRPASSTSPFGTLAWDTDPRLPQLSRALRDLGWTRTHGEDAAHFLVGAGKGNVT